METTLEKLLGSFEGKRFESYELFENYRQEILYIYKRRLNDEISRFPREFWTGEDGLINCRIIIDYLIIDVLGKEIKDIPFLVKFEFLKAHKLVCINNYYESKVDFLMSIYPGSFNLFDFKENSRYLWDKPNKFEIARQLISYNIKKQGYTKKDIYEVHWGDFFNSGNMTTMYKKLFDGDVVKILEFYFEGIEIKKEKIRFVGKWNDDEICYNAIVNLLKNLDKDIDSLVRKDIQENQLQSIATCRFKNIKNIKEFYREYEKKI